MFVPVRRAPCCLVPAILVACSSPAPERATGRLDRLQADAAVREFIYQWKPRMNRNMDFPLLEMTTSEIWDQLGIQVFKIDPSQQILGCTSFVVQDGEATAIGAGLGGHGLMSTAVCDLDGDGRDELAYSFSWGSGIHRSQFGLWKPHAPVGARETVAATSFAHGDARLQPTAEGVLVYVAEYREATGFGPDQQRLGTLRWDPTQRPPLRLAVTPRLDPTLQNQLWTAER